MAGHDMLAFRPKKGTENMAIVQPDPTAANGRVRMLPTTCFSDDEPLPVPKKYTDVKSPISPTENGNSYFDTLRSSRTASVYSLSRLSLSSQLSQLTSLTLPDAISLSTSISSIPTAVVATLMLSNAAGQIKAWLSKATEVLNGLDAEDDVEWAAAGGREGLGEVDAAIGKFEGLVGVYVQAIEDMQEREDIADVPTEQQKAIVDQMEENLNDWDTVKKSLKNVKAQVEIAMEWEELWNVVLGDIGLEMENLSRLVFEMEEARHRALLSDPVTENSGVALDIQELDTIIEEGEKEPARFRNNLPSEPFAPSSPVSPGTGIAPDDTRLLALFAKMQPLRASLDFLPMTLANFQSKAESILPTACEELESRRKSLEKKWKILESDAEGLRKELGEDRWVDVFRGAGRQALKLCESVERALNKLQESIDSGDQHSNPPLLARKVEAYEAKKGHYGAAIEKVLAIIRKGVTDRATVNGEVLRLHLDRQARWESLKANMKDMDIALDNFSLNQNQQLRDSISSIVSMDRSGESGGSAVDTPGSSPASSVVLAPMNGSKRDASPGMCVSSRRSSVGFNSTTRPSSIRRNITMPLGAPSSSQLPRKNPVSRSFSSETGSRGASPSPYARRSLATPTPTPNGRQVRPCLQTENRPRWNSSPKVDYFEFGPKPRSLPSATPPSGRRGSLASRSPKSAGSFNSSHLPLPSPLGRSSPATCSPFVAMHTRPRLASGAQTSMGMRQPSLSSPAQPTDWVRIKEKTPPIKPATKRQSLGIDTTPGSPGSPVVGVSPSTLPRPQRPMTSLASGRRTSMLPLPKTSASPLTSEKYGY